MRKNKGIKITNESIKLGQFLKVLGLIQSGGEARIFLQENNIFVNGNPTDTRGTRIKVGDLIQINEESFEIEN
ncbi:MAG: RNA-binding S4 domain-containing protein [Mycoplasma sp.]|nr:RNA-binding S4 domain-containing protein [Mycoplasma sp.]